MNKEILKRYSLGLLCLIGLLVSCSEEQPANEPALPTGKPVEMRLQVNAPLGSTATKDPETDINRLRMVVFGSMGSPDAGKLILNKYYPTVPVGNALKEIITSGQRDIYLIANEPLSGGGEELDGYKKIATVADVRRLSLVYQGTNSVGIYTPEEIPMFAKQLNQQLRVDVLNEIGGTVERTLAKVTLNLNVKNSNFTTAGKQPVVIDHIIVKNLPESSSLIAQSYTGELLVASEKQNVGVATAVSGYDFSSTNTFYVPEYLFNDPSKGAYIEIMGHVNGDLNRVTKYSVKLGDAMDENNTYGDRYHITRNRHYTFTGDVKSYGEMDGVAVKVTVKPWNTVNMDEETGRYVAFGKVTDSGNNEIVDGGNLDDMGTTLNVECSTNTGGWYTVTRNMKGAIVHQSAATAAVSGVTSQAVSVTIPKLKLEEEELPYLQNYTVSIYHRTIAQESVGPVKAFPFTRYVGFIPNSALIAARWPNDKLSANGLQFAKRGDKVLPSGVAESEDPKRQWKTSQTSSYGTVGNLGFGVSSTAAMAGADHPAAQYCRDMGEGWFLPSRDELILIYKNNSRLGASYSFIALPYWSSTNSSSNVTCGWVVNFSNGEAYQASYGKISILSVRCIRLI